MPGTARSAPKLARPVTFSTPSGRMGRVPTTFRAVSDGISIHRSLCLTDYRHTDRDIRLYISSTFTSALLPPIPTPNDEAVASRGHPGTSNSDALGLKCRRWLNDGCSGLCERLAIRGREDGRYKPGQGAAHTSRRSRRGAGDRPREDQAAGSDPRHRIDHPGRHLA